MTTVPFDLHWVQQMGTSVQRVLRPTTFAEAAELVAAQPDLRFVAGGTDLMLELARDAAGGHVGLIDLTAIQDFRGLDFSDPDDIILHAGATHAAVLASARASELMLPLAQACLEVGSPQLRNRATVVGNLVTASPANDTISALLALDATVNTLRFEAGELTRRTIALRDFYTGFRATVLTELDIVESISVPRPAQGQRGIWVKAGLRKAQAISVVHAGIVVVRDADGVVTSARIALGSVAATVELNAAAATALVGQPLTAETARAAAEAAADTVSPIDDGRATAAYRNDSVVVVVQRALTVLAQGRERERWPERVPLLSTSGQGDAAPAFPVRAPRQSQIGTADEVVVAVNGTQRSGVPPASSTLLDWLRETVGAGTKEGCAEGECGACTVQLDGDAVMSCLVPVAQADGAAVTTIEGLGHAGALNPMQQSFVDKFAVQCGYCIPGFVMAAQTLAEELDTAPTRDEIELALSGNLCRCTGYYNILDAVHAAISGELTP